MGDLTLLKFLAKVGPRGDCNLNWRRKNILHRMKMLALFALAILPALSIAEDPQDKEALCSYLGVRIGDLSEIIDDAVEDIPDEMYRIFKESKICDTLGWTTIPCKGDEKCVEEKTEQMVRNSLVKARKVEKMKKEMNWPGGHEIFHCCKIHAYMKLRVKFMAMKSLLACESDAAQVGETSRKRRNVPPPSYQPQHYQPPYGVNTLWFQYHLCQDEPIYCYFFTDQWRQGDFGNYYLYNNLLKGVDFQDNSLLPLALLSGGSSDSLLPLALLSDSDDDDNLLPLVLLSGGLGSPGYGAGARYRREVDCDEESEDCGRKRREDCDDDDEDCDRKRREADCDEEEEDCGKKRRDLDDCGEDEDRKRREVDCDEEKEDCGRKRRGGDLGREDEEDCDEDGNCGNWDDYFYDD